MRLRKSLQNGQSKLNDFLKAEVNPGASSSDSKKGVDAGTFVLTALLCGVMTLVFVVLIDDAGKDGLMGDVRVEHSLSKGKWKEKWRKEHGGHGGTEPSKPRPSSLNDQKPKLDRPVDTDVIPFSKYLPRHKGWSGKIFRVPSGPLDTCVAWRQTGGCSADGKREPYNDLSCHTRIKPRTGSGYCECGAGTRRALRDCTPHIEFKCIDACRDDSIVTDQKPGGEDEDEYGDGNWGQPAEEVADKDDKIHNINNGQLEAVVLSKNRAVLGEEEGGDRPDAQDEEEEDEEVVTPDRSKCVAWRQTADCTPFGAVEKSFGRSCSAIILNGISGYCKCKDAVSDHGWKGPGVPCRHRPFKCEDECDPKTAKRGQMMHPLLEVPGSEGGPSDPDTPVKRWTKDNHNLHLAHETHERFYDLAAERKQRAVLRQERGHTDPSADQHSEDRRPTLSMEEQHLRHVEVLKQETAAVMGGVGQHLDKHRTSARTAHSEILSDEGIRRFDEYVKSKIDAAMKEGGDETKERKRNADPPPLKNEKEMDIDAFRAKERKKLVKMVRENRQKRTGQKLRHDSNVEREVKREEQNAEVRSKRWRQRERGEEDNAKNDDPQLLPQEEAEQNALGQGGKQAVDEEDARRRQAMDRWKARNGHAEAHNRHHQGGDDEKPDDEVLQKIRERAYLHRKQERH